MSFMDDESENYIQVGGVLEWSIVILAFVGMLTVIDWIF
jgi:hypothetical protein